MCVGTGYVFQVLGFILKDGIINVPLVLLGRECIPVVLVEDLGQCT